MLAACASVGLGACYGTVTARPGGYYSAGYQQPGYVYGGRGGYYRRPGATVVVRPAPARPVYVAPGGYYGGGPGGHHRGGGWRR